MTKNLNNRKIRPRHHVIALLRVTKGKPIAITDLAQQMAIIMPTGGRRSGDNLELSSYISSIRQDDGIVQKTRVSVDDITISHYALLNYWAFDEKGHRLVTENGNKMLTDAEIVEMQTNGVAFAAIDGYTAPVIKPEELTTEDVLRQLSTGNGVILAQDIVLDDDTEIVVQVTDVEPSLVEPDENMNTDPGFLLASDEQTTLFVPEKKKVARHIDPVTKKFCSRDRALALGLITAEAA